MSSQRFSRLSLAALVAALAALVISLGGTSYAAAKINGGSIAKDTTKGKALKAKTVTVGKIADNTLTGAQINESTLGQVPSAADAAPTGPAGGDLAGSYPNPTIKANVIGATELGTITQRTGLEAIGPNASGSATVQCQADEQFIGGGNDAGSATTARVVASRFEAPNGWRVFLFNDSAGSSSVTAHV